MIRIVSAAPCSCGERDWALIDKSIVCIGCQSIWGRINGRFRTVPDGTPGVRDPDHRCDMFSPGTPNNGGCQGDGHYLCAQCVLKELGHVLRDHK